jgi:hypothetical protein
MKTIIALRGRGNSGKSETIRILHSLLLQNNYQQVRSNFTPAGGDFLTVFTKKEILIGITSSGDTYDLVHDRLQELVTSNCSICVCACRTYDRVQPGTNAAVLEFKNYVNQFVEKTIDNNVTTRLNTNTSDAQNLLSIISNMI